MPEFIEVGPAEETFANRKTPTPANSSPPSPSFPAPDLSRVFLAFIAASPSLAALRSLVSDRDLGYNPGAEIFSCSGAYFYPAADSEI